MACMSTNCFGQLSLIKKIKEIYSQICAVLADTDAIRTETDKLTATKTLTTVSETNPSTATIPAGATNIVLSSASGTTALTGGVTYTIGSGASVTLQGPFASAITVTPGTGATVTGYYEA